MNKFSISAGITPKIAAAADFHPIYSDTCTINWTREKLARYLEYIKTR